MNSPEYSDGQARDERAARYLANLAARVRTTDSPEVDPGQTRAEVEALIREAKLAASDDEQASISEQTR